MRCKLLTLGTCCWPSLAVSLNRSSLTVEVSALILVRLFGCTLPSTTTTTTSPCMWCRFQRAAGKNAFQLLSQHRYDHAAAFFLLARQYVTSCVACVCTVCRHGPFRG